MTQYKRERVKSQWIKRKQWDLFRGSSTQLNVPAFTQKDFESTNLSTEDSHTGNLHQGFGATTTGSTQLLSQLQIQPLHKRLGTKPPISITSQLEGWAQSQTTNQPLTRGIGHKVTTPQINLYPRGITQSRRVYNLVIKRPQTNLFHKNKDPIDRIEW